VVVWTDSWHLVACEGTTTFQQAAEEGWYSPTGPQNFGQFAAHSLWVKGSQYILEALEQTDYFGGKPIFFTGHSYGGACVLTTAVRLKVARPNLLCRYLTYGSPAIGDIRAYNFLRLCDGLQLINTGDLVPAVPFGFAELGPVLPIVGPVLVARLDRWVNAPFAWTQDANGIVTQGSSQVNTSATIRQQYIDIQLGIQSAPLDAHRLITYIARIRLREPGPAWPVCDQLLYDTLTDCTGPAFGWWLLGGLVPEAPRLTGAIALGDTSPIPDGSDCAHAEPLVLGETYDESTDGTGEFYRSRIAFDTYLVATLTRGSGPSTLQWFDGGGCQSVTFQFTLSTLTTKTIVFKPANFGLWLLYDVFLYPGGHYSIDTWPSSPAGSLSLGGDLNPVSPASGAVSLGDVLTSGPGPAGAFDCPTAFALNLEFTYLWHWAPVPASLWIWKWVGLAAGTYYLTSSITGDTSPDGEWAFGADCASLAENGFLPIPSGTTTLTLTTPGIIVAAFFTFSGGTVQDVQLKLSTSP